MPWIRIIVICVLPALGVSCAAAPVQREEATQPLVDELVALERGALDRWLKLDPKGYLDLYESEITYFDPQAERRVAGVDTLRARFAPIAQMKPQFSDPRYELMDPKVQHYQDVAILTFNLINYAKFPDGVERQLARWNSTEVYRRIHGTWRIVHSHWSYIQGQQKAGSAP